jgi:hypothetical protein
MEDKDWYPGWCKLWENALIAENELEDEMEEE